MATRRHFLKTSAAMLLAQGAGLHALGAEKAAGPLTIAGAQIVRFLDRDTKKSDLYLELVSAGGLKGYGGPLLKEQAEAVPASLGELLRGRDAAPPESANFHTLWAALHPGKSLESYAEGRDPLTGEKVWGIKRAARHTPTGWTITALSAADNALWDLRGKHAGLPVRRMLGGARETLPCYASMLGHSTEPAEARKIAREFYDKGFHRQKWFFMKGPVDGKEGLRANIELVRQIREELGPEAMLMFDGIQYVWKSDSLDYAIELARGILPYKPHWLEEPLRPDDIEGYERLKGETGITLATGEHTYTRWNIRPFLDKKLVNFVQSDPEWCGGLSEWLKICEMVKGYPGVQVVPHGHHVLGAAAGIASQPEALCPMLEYLIKSRLAFQHCQTRPLLAESGSVRMPEEPGLGPSIDERRCERA